MEALEIFPSRLLKGHVPLLDDYKEDLVDYLYDFRSKNESSSRSSLGGWQSNCFMHYEESFQPFGDRMHKALEPYLLKLMNDIEVFNDSRPILEFYNVWFNINGTGALNRLHTHPHSIYSGVMWIKAPENCGNLVMVDPSAHNMFGIVPTEYEFEPVEGDIILFPSHVPHYVKPNNSDEDRISLSFNIILLPTPYNYEPPDEEGSPNLGE